MQLKVANKMKSAKRSPDFKALELKINEESVASHTIYFKEHTVRERSEDKPSGRTLFIVNVPPYADGQSLSNAFSEAGKVIKVSLSAKPTIQDIKDYTFLSGPTETSFHVAYLVFSKVAELDKAIKLKSLRPLNHNGHEIKCGLKKWIDQYNDSVYQPNVLKQKIEEFMKNHDKESKLAEEKEKAMEQEDDEGWVTVTKKGKVQSFARTEKVENKILAKEEQGKKRKELRNFYTFQIRESKMKHIVALRQKFEEDKKKIAQIKQSRRFKPF